MNYFERTTGSLTFKLAVIVLLVFSLVITPTTTPFLSAENGSDGDYREGHGSIKNEQGEIDYDEATINKQVSFGNKPGEYFIDLTVKGKSKTSELTTDIVIPYDLSNSMAQPIDGGSTRAAVAKDALENFLNGLLDGQTNQYRVAFVPFGSSIMDGNTRTYVQNSPNPNGGNYNVNSINPYNYYVGNFTNNASDIIDKVPSTADHGNHGGTFTQQALERAGEIMATSNADRKIIVTITDGLPTISKELNGTVWGTGSSTQAEVYMTQHRQNTINAANALKGDYTLYSIGIGLTQSSNAEREVIEGIAGRAENAYYANSVDQLVNALNDISSQLIENSVVNGSIEDPITDEFILPENPFGQASSENLTDGEFHLSASDSSLLDTVQVRAENQHILVDGLNLGQDEWVKVRYKVQIDTDNPELDPNELYKTNGTTTLTPDGDDPDNKREFPEPEASAEPIKVSGKKAWVDWGYDVHRPEKITLQLVREINGQDVVVDEVVVQNNGTDVWEFEFDNAFVYDTKGEKIEYKIREIMPSGDEYYDLEYGNISEETTDARNVFQQDAKIQLVKTAKSTSELGEDEIEVGKDIEYTFEITNTGNLPLKDINLEDELDGISAISYDTLNGEPIDSIADVVMKPGDVIIATATYEVTQEDYNYGQVNNHAEVVGTPTVPNPDQFQGSMVEFDDTPVKDDDDASIPGELNPEISLTKTANKEKVSEAGEEIEYTFEITNTGDTTLTEVTLNDPMLGGEITLDVDTLEPGESTTITVPYEVTQEDVNNGEIVNKANVEGTPPPAYTENPDNPDKVTDEDNEIVEAEQSSEIELVKKADKDNLVKGETITYTFTATNTGNTTLTNVEITDILDGISDIEYLTVNGESNFDKDNIVLQPGDVLVAEATYEVTQDDVDTGQVYNKATVTGIDPKDEEVTDEDDEAVPSEVDLGIELVKTSDKQYVTTEDQEIEYTFEVTNTSNVTLKDVEVIDEMLKDAGVDVELEKTTLAPGETTTATATYTVTKEDIEAGVIKNVATTTGTPPNPEDTPPESPPAEDEIPVAKIDLEKSVNPNVYTKAGQELTYTLVITNTGEVTLNDLTLTDDMLGGNIELDVDTLAPGEKTTVNVPYTVTEADVEAGEVLNTAETEGTPEGYDPDNPNTPGKVTDEDEAEAKYAALALVKTSDKETVEEAGEVITYTFEVTNVGKTEISDIVVNDEMLAELDIDVVLEETTLQPGESTIGKAEYTVTQEDIDNGGVYNVATTTGETPGDPEEPPVSPPDEEYVPSDRNPKIELVKSTETEEYTEVGQEIEYVFTVTNIGNTTLNNVKVEDETFKLDVGLKKEGEEKTQPTVTLAPGESATGTYTHIVTQKDLDNGDIHNFANTEGTPPPVIDPEDPDNPVEQDPVTDEDDEEVPGKIVKDLALEKEADKQLVEKAGEEITYTLTVTNTGNVTLNNVTVNDEMLGGDLKVTPSTLAPGETGTVTGTYTVTQEDINHHEKIINIATATGTPPGYDPEDPPTDPEDPNYPPVTPPVEEEVPVINDPEITLIKQADKEKLVKGETVTYTFTATNTGNTTLNKVNLVDELEGLSEIAYLTVNDNEVEDAANITLKPGDVLVAEATYVVTQADVDANELYNKATVEGTPPPLDNPEDPDNPIERDPVTDDDDEKVPSEHKPEISLEKSTKKEEVSKAGEIITYKFVVTNTGNVTLDNVKINDAMLEAAGIEVELEKEYLAPGESTLGYADYVVTQDDIDNADKIVNIATAEGTPPTDPENPEDPEDPVESPPSEEEVPVIKEPAIDIEKTAEEEIVREAGETITYNFVVTNTGNQTLNDVRVIDEMLENAGVTVELEKTRLAPGESTTGSAVYTVTQADIDSGIVENIATSTGTPPGKDPGDPDNPVSPPDREEVPTERNPDISLDKTSDTIRVTKTGQTITYKFVVTNTGNVTLKDPVINDPMLGGEFSVGVTELAPGESTTLTRDYVVTEADMKLDKLINVATVTGTPPGYNPNDPDSPQKPTDEDDYEIKVDKSKPGIILPNTATEMYSMILLGVTLILLGITVIFTRRTKRA